MSEPWWQQYEERAQHLDGIGQHGAADDIRTLVDGLRDYERRDQPAVRVEQQPDEKHVRSMCDKRDDCWPGCECYKVPAVLPDEGSRK